jgi:hypothetical protein
VRAGAAYPLRLSDCIADAIKKSSTVSHLTCGGLGLKFNRPPGSTATRLEGNTMCDQAYVNLLRERVRQKEAEERRIAAFGPAPSTRFVPLNTPAQSQPQDADERKHAGGSG